jgi:hypothetical protein
MRFKVLTVLAAAAFGALALTGPATAGGPAETTVTISGGGGDYFGYVRSTKPKVCAKDRKVKLYKQLGPQQNPQTDDVINSDTASQKTDKGYKWDTGSTGVHSGKVYARAGRIDGCKADSSRTIQAS